MPVKPSDTGRPGYKRDRGPHDDDQGFAEETQEDDEQAIIDYDELAFKHRQLQLRYKRLELSYKELEQLYGEKCGELIRLTNGVPEGTDQVGHRLRQNVPQAQPQIQPQVAQTQPPPHQQYQPSITPVSSQPQQPGFAGGRPGGPSGYVTTGGAAGSDIPPGWLRCEVCNISVSGEEPMRAHLDGEKHKKELRRYMMRHGGGSGMY